MVVALWQLKAYVITNEACELLEKRLGIDGAIGCRFYSYERVQKALDEKFPAGEPITFYVPMDEMLGGSISNVLSNLDHKSYFNAETNALFNAAWKNRKVI